MVDGLVLSVSATTRAMRPGEVDGREYHFLSAGEFKRRVEQGRFLEWASYSGNLYGTPRDAVEENIAAGLDVLLEIELAGAWQVHSNHPDSLMIFIMPPSLEELERRLRGRNTESEEAIRIRMARAREELEEVAADMRPEGSGRFDYVIVNDDVPRAAQELAQVILRAREEDEQAHDR